MLVNDQKPLLIGVMGVTGVGKSHFIKTLTGDPDVIVSRRSKSCTRTVRKCAPIHVGGYAVELVDTPGFGDTVMTDPEILKLIAQWLKDSYDDDRKLHGIVYLHSIMTTRMDGEGVKSLNIFGNICGPNYLANTVLVTTKWDKCSNDTEDLEEATEREDEMKKEFWASFFARGVMYEQSDNTKDTFERIISRIVDQPVNQPELQKEVGEGKDLKDTAAGSGLQSEVRELLAKHQAAFDELARQTAERNEALKEQLEKSIAQSRKDLQELNSSFEKKSNEKELYTIRVRLATWSTAFRKNVNQQPTITRRDQFADRVDEITAIKASLSYLGACGMEGFGAVGKEVDDGMIKAKSKSEEENTRVKSAEESLETLKSDYRKWNTEYITLVKTPAASATINVLQALETRLLAIEQSVESYDEKGMLMQVRGLAKLVKDSRVKIAESLLIERARRAVEAQFRSLEGKYQECKIIYDTRNNTSTGELLAVLNRVLEELSQLQGGLRGLEGKDINGKTELVTDVNNLKSTVSRYVKSENDRLLKIAETPMIEKTTGAHEKRFRFFQDRYNDCQILFHIHNSQATAEGLAVLEGVLEKLSQLQEGLRELEGKDIDGKTALVTDVNNLKSTVSRWVTSESDRLLKIAETPLIEKTRRMYKANFISLEGKYNECQILFDKCDMPLTRNGLRVLEGVLEELFQMRGGLKALEGNEIEGEKELLRNVNRLKSTLPRLVKSESERFEAAAREMAACHAKYNTWVCDYNSTDAKRLSSARTNAALKVLSGMVEDMNKLVASGTPEFGLQKPIMAAVDILERSAWAKIEMERLEIEIGGLTAKEEAVLYAYLIEHGDKTGQTQIDARVLMEKTLHPIQEDLKKFTANRLPEIHWKKPEIAIWDVRNDVTWTKMELIKEF